MSEYARLRWLCRRGMKELDVVLTHYLEHDYQQAKTAQQKAFRRLLEMQDPVIYGLLLGREPSDDPAIRTLLQLLAVQQ